MKKFLAGFAWALVLFVGINLLAAQVLSDCGLPSVINLDACADDIARAGWPFQFFEEGGFNYHREFKPAMLAADIGSGLLMAGLIGGWTVHRRSEKKTGS